MDDRHKPRAYDLSDPAEFRRLINETAGYMLVSINHGTDTEGRRFALAALNELRAKLKAEALAQSPA